MDLGIAGRVAIVGGATRGLGLATACRLVSEGVHVAVCGRSKESLKQAEVHLSRAADGHDRFLTVQADLSDRDGPEKLIQAALERFDKIDIVVPNSGGPPNGGAQSVGDDDVLWQNAFDGNFWSTLRLVKEALPGMIDRQWGRVVIIGSTAVREPVADLVLSNATRSAIWSWAKTLASEVAKDGVTVNMAMPGLHNTDRVAERMNAEALARRLMTIPAQRVGEPEEFAALMAFLCSQSAGFISGESVAVDGGALRGF